MGQINFARLVLAKYVSHFPTDAAWPKYLQHSVYYICPRLFIPLNQINFNIKVKMRLSWFNKLLFYFLSIKKMFTFQSDSTKNRILFDWGKHWTELEDRDTSELVETVFLYLCQRYIPWMETQGTGVQNKKSKLLQEFNGSGSIKCYDSLSSSTVFCLYSINFNGM